MLIQFALYDCRFGRHFTNPDELKAREERERKDREWRKQHGEASDSDEDESGSEEESSSSEESSSEGEEQGAKGGVSSLIEVENPNRAVKKVNKKVLEQTPGTEKAVPVPKTELSRREREEIEKQRAKEHYDKLHAG